MLGLIRRLFGRSTDAASSNPTGIERRLKPRTTAASIIAENPAPQPSPTVTDAADDTTEDSGLSLEEPRSSLGVAESGTDPYDTGAFVARDAWNKANRRRND